MRITQCRRAGALALTGASLVALIAGCGSGSTNAARIRSVDAAVNAGTANIIVNNASAYGDQQPFGQGNNTISPYLYLGTGSTTSFTYTTSASTSSGVTFNTTTLQLSDNVFYSAYLIGRADVAGNSFLNVVVTDDSHTVPAGKALIRVLHAAPDAGTINVQVNGAAPGPAFSGIAYVTPTSSFYSAPYVAVSPGTLSVTVTSASGGSTLVPATTVTVSTGSAYTLIVTEPTTAPTYALQRVQD